MTAETLLVDLRKAVEATDIDADGSEWGTVYLHNVGRGHAFAGFLSALTARGDYRPTSDTHFGRVKMAPKARTLQELIADKAPVKELVAALKSETRARNATRLAAHRASA
jgi:hypothetical protein